ncbi:MAG: hypothetical protein Q7R35_03390 [Elusimicrobiota bacterium]|nr:hypothetical protein [Elusimicrobiota bacterium]
MKRKNDELFNKIFASGAKLKGEGLKDKLDMRMIAADAVGISISRDEFALAQMYGTNLTALKKQLQALQQEALEKDSVLPQGPILETIKEFTPLLEKETALQGQIEKIESWIKANKELVLKFTIVEATTRDFKKWVELKLTKPE